MPRAVWRRLYNMPVNDPRALEATEEEVLLDLLIVHMQNRDRAAADDPVEAARQMEEETPEVMREIVASARAFVQSSATMGRLATLAEKAGHVAPTVPKRPVMPRPQRKVRA